MQLANFGRRLEGEPDEAPGFTLAKITIDDPGTILLSGSAEHLIMMASADPSNRVPGTVFALSPEELAAADDYEVPDYRRVEVLLSSGRRAWAYVKA